MIETTQNQQDIEWGKTLSSNRPNAKELVERAMLKETEYTHYAVINNSPKYQVILGKAI